MTPIPSGVHHGAPIERSEDIGKTVLEELRGAISHVESGLFTNGRDLDIREFKSQLYLIVLTPEYIQVSLQRLRYRV